MPQVAGVKGIVARAVSEGATLAGLVATAQLRQAPSYRRFGAPSWPQWATGALVLALAHPTDQPQLDWWGGSWGTRGNRTLAHICEGLQAWLGEQGARAVPLPYQVSGGGIYLKEAAAAAGLGCIGNSNLLITPSLGPRVRLRALFVDVDVAEVAQSDFDPCQGCDAPCRAACPQEAFAAGSFQVQRCSAQMRLDESRPRQSSGYRIGYCRACELSCPVGR